MPMIKLEKRYPHIADEDFAEIFNAGYLQGWENARKKAIPIELYEQIKGERDVAIEQLKSLNVELFEKPYRKAIPVEWIDGYIKRRANDVNIYAEILFISDMVKEWEKENETNR